MKTTVIFSTLFLVSLAVFDTVAYARVFITKDKALELAFSDADKIEKKSYILNKDQVNKIEKLSRSKLESKLFLFYVGIKDGSPSGYAAIDTHTIRTKTQTIMVVINPDGTLNYTEILAFYEPLEYKATQNWVDLYSGKKISDKLKIGYDIPNISGATLTSYGMASAVRKILAAFEVLIKGEITN